MPEQLADTVDPANWTCPAPLRDQPVVVMGHGGGGALSAELMEHDTRIHAVTDLVELLYFALVHDIPRIRPVRIHTAEHFHQGGFPCPVLSDQAVNFAFFDFEINIGERFNSGKFLGNIVHFQNVLAHHGASFNQTTVTIEES